MIDSCTADYCPTCGNPRELQDRVSIHGLTLTGYLLVYGDTRLRLTAGVARFARLIMRRGSASHEFVRLSLPTDSCPSLPHVYALKLRRAIAEVTGGEVALKTIHSWGYEIALGEKQRLAA